jgi:hypothetical protein
VRATDVCELHLPELAGNDVLLHIPLIVGQSGRLEPGPGDATTPRRSG